MILIFLAQVLEEHLSVLIVQLFNVDHHLFILLALILFLLFIELLLVR